MIKNKIDFNIINNENIYVKLKKSFISFLINIIKKSNTVFDKKVFDQLYRMSKNHKVSLSFIKFLANSLEIPLEDFEQDLILITSNKSTDIGIKNPKIPFNFATKEGVRFTAAIMGDGELNNQFQVRYNNQDKKLIDIILKSAKKIFGSVDYKLYYRKDKTYQLHFPKIIGLIVSLFGLKPGYKSLTNYPIPQFIFRLNNRLKAVFIKQFFNDEGNVRLKDRRLQVKQTILTTEEKNELKANCLRYCPNSLSGLQFLLLSFDINSKISLGNYRKNKADWELSIYGKENLEKFQKYIDFDLKYKTELLNKTIKSYKFPSAPRNKRLEFALKKAKEVQSKYSYITKYLLAKECNRSLKTATYYLVDLKKRKLIRCIRRPRKKKGFPLPHIYKI